MTYVTSIEVLSDIGSVKRAMRILIKRFVTEKLRNRLGPEEVLVATRKGLFTLIREVMQIGKAACEELPILGNVTR